LGEEEISSGASAARGWDRGREMRRERITS
jgi:hypothetical protein